MTSIWLASGSPRRREQLAGCGVAVDAQPSGEPEHRLPAEDPVAWAFPLACAKAAALEPPPEKFATTSTSGKRLESNNCARPS